MPLLPVPSPFPYDPDDPLKRIPTKTGEYQGESVAANAALVRYAHMGTRRSLAKLRALFIEQADNDDIEEKPPTTNESTLNTWSMSFDWQIRVQAWEALRRQEFESRLMDHQVETALRDFEQGSALRDLADKILEAAPEFIKETSKVEGSRIVVTKELDGALMVRLMETGSKMARTALGMSTEKKTVEITNDFLASLPDELLDLVASGKITQEELIDLARRAAEE